MKKVPFNAKFCMALAIALPLLTSCFSKKGDYDGREGLVEASSFHKTGQFGAAATNRKTILFYMAADNTLSSYAISNKTTLLKGYAPAWNDDENIVLLFYDIQDAAPVLERLTASTNGTLNEEILKTYPDSLNTARAETLTQVINDAQGFFPSGSNGLIIWSHGSGWLPKRYYYDPTKFSSVSNAGLTSAMNQTSASSSRQEIFPSLEDDPYRNMVKSFAEHNGIEMDISELAGCLPFKYDYIILDACLMGDVEVAYELRNKADYLAFSPTEVMGEGLLLYDTFMKYLFDQSYTTPQALQKILADAYDFYNAQTDAFRSYTVSLVDCSKLTELGSVCKSIYSSHRSTLDSGLSESGLQGFFRFNRHWFFDIDDVMSRLATSNEYSSFHKALNDVVIYKAATPSFISIKINTYSGLATYVYEPSSKYLNDFYKTLSWNDVTGLVP
jgi:hypothetical protein